MTSNSEAGFTNQLLISEGRKQESALRANHHDKPQWCLDSDISHVQQGKDAFKH